MFAEQQRNHAKELQQNKDSCKYRFKVKNDEIKELHKKWEDFNSRKNRNQAE